jgi:hypothetical protein
MVEAARASTLAATAAGGMDDGDLAKMFDERAAAMRAAAETMSAEDARLELLRIADAYHDQAKALRERRR